MLFKFIKAIEPAFYPLGFLWVLWCVGAVIALWRKRWFLALGFITLAALFTAIGSTSLSYRLLASLEKPFHRPPDHPLPSGDAVVVLGGVLLPSEYDLSGFDLADTADRIVTAFELVRQKKAPVLVVGGGGNWEAKTESGEAAVVARWASTWNLAADEVIALRASANTRDEALQVKSLAENRGWKRVLLVTSASHMKRSAACFRSAGVPIEPVACDFRGLNNLNIKEEVAPPFNPIPKAERFLALQIYLHERLGWVYYRARGWITQPDPEPDSELSKPGGSTPSPAKSAPK